MTFNPLLCHLEPAEMSLEEIEERLSYIVKSERISQLKSSVWKECLEDKSSFDGSDHSKGRSMLVAALMGIITSNCDNAHYSSFQPLLPTYADTRDSGQCPPLTRGHLSRCHGHTKVQQQFSRTALIG